MNKIVKFILLSSLSHSYASNLASLPLSNSIAEGDGEPINCFKTPTLKRNNLENSPQNRFKTPVLEKGNVEENPKNEYVTPILWKRNLDASPRYKQTTPKYNQMSFDLNEVSSEEDSISDHREAILSLLAMDEDVKNALETLPGFDIVLSPFPQHQQDIENFGFSIIYVQTSENLHQEGEEVLDNRNAFSNNASLPEPHINDKANSNFDYGDVKSKGGKSHTRSLSTIPEDSLPNENKTSFCESIFTIDDSFSESNDDTVSESHVEENNELNSNFDYGDVKSKDEKSYAKSLRIIPQSLPLNDDQPLCCESILLTDGSVSESKNDSKIDNYNPVSGNIINELNDGYYEETSEELGDLLDLINADLINKRPASIDLGNTQDSSQVDIASEEDTGTANTPDNKFLQNHYSKFNDLLITSFRRNCPTMDDYADQIKERMEFFHGLRTPNRNMHESGYGIVDHGEDVPPVYSLDDDLNNNLELNCNNIETSNTTPTLKISDVPCHFTVYSMPRQDYAFSIANSNFNTTSAFRLLSSDPNMSMEDDQTPYVW